MDSIGRQKKKKKNEKKTNDNRTCVVVGEKTNDTLIVYFCSILNNLKQGLLPAYWGKKKKSNVQIFGGTLSSTNKQASIIPVQCR